MRADTIFYNGNIYNTPFKSFFKGCFSVKGEKILHIGRGDVPSEVQADNMVDLQGRWVIPGLIDSHMHVESSMLAPRPFAKLMVENGITTVVSEPHEIANVTGMDGVVAMIDAAKGAVMDVLYAVPSSVPSTSREYETTGGEINMPELMELVKHKEVVCLGEVMNTYKILSDPDDKQNQFVRYLKEHRPDMPLEGHCPRIVGEPLCQYVYTGIGSDHTEHDVDAFLQRVFNGMIFQIQDKMAKPEIARAIKEYNLYENVSIVTDDTHPANLIYHGHLNSVVMEMVKCGLDFEKAVYCATATPARRMRLYDRGQIMPGLLADFCILDTLDEIKPLQTYKNGRLVFDKAVGNTFETEKAFPDEFYRTMKLGTVSPEIFDIKAPVENGEIKVTGLEVLPDFTRTPKAVRTLTAENGVLKLDDDTRKITVIERHGKNGNVFSTIATGSCMVEGAVASSYAHDHHNLIVIGDSNEDMALAANTVIANCGGLAVVKDGRVIAQCRLEVCGLMSERDPYAVAGDILNVEKAMRDIGYVHYNPVMSLATTCLPVSMDV
ncbi:MAG: adenine deaminase, partial [Oscillospiraceae bacterium]|nr:adenine deaminase [Oscillospiraceae bacterium]